MSGTPAVAVMRGAMSERSCVRALPIIATAQPSGKMSAMPTER